MLRLALTSIAIAAAAPAIAQINNYPAARTDVGSSMGWGGGCGACGGPAFWNRANYDFGQPARSDQLRIGSAVYSTEGPLIGRVAYTDSQVAVVKTQRYALRLPAKAFGVKKNGNLLLPLSPANFDNLAKRHGARVG
jgi:hypothetical protein